MIHFLLDIGSVFRCASLGCTLGRLIAWALTPMVLCGIACGQERPKSYFYHPSKTVLMAQKPASKAVRPRSYFWSGTKPQSRPDQSPAEPADNDVKPVPDPDASPIPRPEDHESRKPAAHVVPKVTLRTFMQSAIEIYDDLPKELGDEAPKDWQPIEVTVYLKSADEYAEFDPRLKIDTVVGKIPYPVAQDEELRYPVAVDLASQKCFFGSHLRSADTLVAAINEARHEAGLKAEAPEMPEIIVGEVPRDLCGWISCDESRHNEWHFDNAGDVFTHKAFTIAIPTGMGIKGGTDKRGPRINFIGTKPKVKANGFWHMWHDIQAIVNTTDRVLFLLDWWQVLVLKKRG